MATGWLSACSQPIKDPILKPMLAVPFINNCPATWIIIRNARYFLLVLLENITVSIHEN